MRKAHAITAHATCNRKRAMQWKAHAVKANATNILTTIKASLLCCGVGVGEFAQRGAKIGE